MDRNPVMETEEFRLNCFVAQESKNNLWKSCVWKRGSDGATCTQIGINDYQTAIGSCDTPLNNLRVSEDINRNRFQCGITIPSANLKDKGNWICELRKCKEKEDGGCKSKVASECGGTSTVNVKVFIIILDAKIITYIESNYN